MPLNTNEPYHRVLSETSQTQESACPLIPLLRGTQDDQIRGDSRKMVITRGWRLEEMGSSCLTSTEFYLCLH